MKNETAWVMIIAAIVFFFMAVQTARTESWLARKAKIYNCTWVNKQLEHMTPEQLEKKARKWRVPEEYINLAKACPQSSKPFTNQ